jgi:glycosyltransferase involved in cell wall biosynthesis
MLAARGWPCGAFCGPQLDFEEPEPLAQLLRDHGLSFETRHSTAGPVPLTLFHFVQGGVPVTVYRPEGAPQRQPPGPAGWAPFLALLEEALHRFQPDLLLTYGGHGLAEELMARARRRGLAVVFLLHNFAYQDAGLFRAADAVLVPSQFAREHYRRTLGLECVALPCPLSWSRLRCPVVQGQYATFVNPQPHKGVFVFARIALELGRCRPDLPLLVVEGRAKAGWLVRAGLQPAELPNLYVMANTPDPRDYYRVSRVVLMPSLWQESFGRVAAEALLNGIPVLASRRGALPETLAQAGYLFDVPAQYTPDSRDVPTAAEVAPWVETVLRLWDEPALHDCERQRGEAAAQGWLPERLFPQYEAFFTALVRRRGGEPGGRP